MNNKQRAFALGNLPPLFLRSRILSANNRSATLVTLIEKGNVEGPPCRCVPLIVSSCLPVQNRSKELELLENALTSNVRISSTYTLFIYLKCSFILLGCGSTLQLYNDIANCGRMHRYIIIYHPTEMLCKGNGEWITYLAIQVGNRLTISAGRGPWRGGCRE